MNALERRLTKALKQPDFWAVLGVIGGAIGLYFVLQKANEVIALLPVAPRSSPLTLSNQKLDFVNRWLAAIQQAAPGTPDYTAVLVIAHGAYESGYGKGFAAKSGNNIWNLTDGQSVAGVQHRVYGWKGDVIEGSDVSYAPGQTGAVPIRQLFNAYPDDATAVNDYFRFLSAARYADAKAKLMNGDASFVVDLGKYRLAAGAVCGKKAAVVNAWTDGTKGGFYTYPIECYQAEFTPVLHDVEGLTLT